MNICIQVFVWTYIFISLGYIPRSGIAGWCGNSMFDLLRNCHTVFQSGDTILTLPPAVYEGSNSSTSSPALVIFYLLNYSHPSGYEVIPHCGFDFHFLGG